MALSANIDNLKMREKSGRGYELSVPVAASTHIYKGAQVCMNAGYAEPVTVTGAVKYIGRAQEEADNSSGSDGDINVTVLRQAIIRVPWASAAVTDVGKLIWFTADDTPTLTPQANIQAAGRVVDVEVGVATYIDQSDNSDETA